MCGRTGANCGCSSCRSGHPNNNPDEQVWNEVKNNRIGKQPVKNKEDLKARLTSALDSLKQNSRRIISFFHLPDTEYAAGVA